MCRWCRHDRYDVRVALEMQMHADAFGGWRLEAGCGLGEAETWQPVRSVKVTGVVAGYQRSSFSYHWFYFSVARCTM